MKPSRVSPTPYRKSPPSVVVEVVVEEGVEDKEAEAAAVVSEAVSLAEAKTTPVAAVNSSSPAQVVSRAGTKAPSTLIYPKVSGVGVPCIINTDDPPFSVPNRHPVHGRMYLLQDHNEGVTSSVLKMTYK